jgi:hypothetical protein
MYWFLLGGFCVSRERETAKTYLARRVSFSSLLKVLVMSVPIARAIFMK